MNHLQLSDFNLPLTLTGGQSFGWEREGDVYRGFTKSRGVTLEQQGDKILWQTYPVADDFDFLKSYLRLDTDYPRILKTIRKDRHVKNAMKKNPHVRLLNQDFEETLLSFIMSINKNIPAIRQMIRRVNRKWGRRVMMGDREIYLFPKTQVLAQATVDELRECGLGFRAKYVKAAAQHLVKTDLARRILSMTEDQARAALTEIYGVGEKVADCVLVFSLGFDNVTPLDVWAHRAFTTLYGLNPKMKYADMRAWVSRQFNGYAGWAGQYLFEHIRKAGVV